MIYLIAEVPFGAPATWPKAQGKWVDWITVKIGYTGRSSADGRHGSLRTGNPRRLVLLATLEGGESDERAAHVALARWRMQGEWFQLPGSYIGRATWKDATSVARWLRTLGSHGVQNPQDRFDPTRNPPENDLTQAARLEQACVEIERLSQEMVHARGLLKEAHQRECAQYREGYAVAMGRRRATGEGERVPLEVLERTLPRWAPQIDPLQGVKM